MKYYDNPIYEAIFGFIIGIILSPFSNGMLFFSLYAMIRLAMMYGCEGDVFLRLGQLCVSIFAFILGRTILLEDGESPINNFL
jgi:hypothetical protein